MTSSQQGLERIAILQRMLEEKKIYRTLSTPQNQVFSKIKNKVLLDT
jgi:hypothetical protein